MSRPHGEAEVDARYPRAHAICDRCGRKTNHFKLRWQMDWRGPRMQNLRILVCHSCYDAPQQNGQRTIMIPADPLPIMNARPENYVADSNPLSGIGANPTPTLSTFGAMIGNMTEGGGTQAAFDGNSNKPSWMSAVITHSLTGFNNYVGINWSEYPATADSNLNSPILTHTVLGYTIKAPNDSTFGATRYAVQGSNVGGNTFTSWTTLATDSFSGTVGETVTDVANVGGRFQFHRVAFYGVGTPIAVAQVQFNVTDGSSINGSI
jgi:hypothetical protein